MNPKHTRILSLLLLATALVVGGDFLLDSGGKPYFGSVLGTTTTQVSTESDVDFNAGNIGQGLEVTGSGSGAGVQLAGSVGPLDFEKFKAISIDNSANSNVLTDYQVLLVIDTATLISAGTMQSDCDDIRFWNDNNDNLSYFLESGCNTTNTRIWVKVDSIAANASTNIKFFYSNALATSESSGSNTYDYYNDFSSNPNVVHIVNGVWDLYYFDITDFDMQGTATDIDYTVTNSVFSNYGFGNGYFGWRDSITTPTADHDLQELNGQGIATNNLYSPRKVSITDDTGNNAYYITNFDYLPSNQNKTIQFTDEYASSRTLRLIDKANNHAELISASIPYTTNYVARYYIPASIYFSDGAGATYDSVNQRLNFDLYRATNQARLQGYMDNLRVRKFSSPQPTVANIGAEQGMITQSADWESQSLDLIWNGGFGDGTGASTALSANFSDLGAADAQIEFFIKAAASESALSSESYVSIGLANSGTSFSATKTDLDNLGIATGFAGRYVKLKATLSTNGSVNPFLDNINLLYLVDNTEPSNIADTDILMQRANGGASVVDSGWTNNPAPMFNWDDAVDDDSGVAGYCLYLGQDELVNPTDSKGLLGTGNLSVPGDPCVFGINASEIDFATQSFRGGSWLISDNQPYFLNILAVDYFGLVTTDPIATFEFMYDDDEPNNPSYLSMPSDFVSTKDVTMTWPVISGGASDVGPSGVAGLQYRIGPSGTWYGESHTGDPNDFLVNDGSYTTDPTYDYPNLLEGINQVYLRVVDNAGNVSAYLNGTIKINTVAPSAPVNLVALPNSNDVNAYSFDWDPPGSFTGLEENITYCYSFNLTPSIQSCSFTSAGVTMLPESSYANTPGTNTLYVVAKDEAGNINYSVSAQVNFEYTGDAPGIPQEVQVSDISIKETASWKLAVSWGQPIFTGAGINEYVIYRSTINSSCSDSFGNFSYLGSTSGLSYVDLNLSQQNYYYCVIACDNASSCSAVSTTVGGFPDGRYTTPADLTSGPVANNVTTRAAEIRWTTSRNSDSKIAYGTTSGVYFEEEPSKSTQEVDHTIRLTGLQPGTQYFYKAKWTDEDGNTGLSDEKSFVTNPAPIIKDVKALNIGLSNAYIEFTSINSSKAKVYYGNTVSFGALKETSTSLSESKYTVSLEGLLDDTKYFYKINPVDQDGYEYEGTVLDFTTIPRPRISNVQISEVYGTSQPTVEVSWESNTAISSILEYYPIDNIDFVRDEVDIELVSGERKFSISELLPETTYLLTVRGIDFIGNEAKSDEFRFTTATDSRPPQIFDLKVEATVGKQSSSTNTNSSGGFVVSWKTDEASTSQVEYGLGSDDSYTQSTSKDNDLSFNHTVVVSGLQPSTVYHLRPVSVDSANNQTEGIKQIAITPEASESALNIVLGTLGEIFNFL